MSRWLRDWGAALVWAGFIFAASSRPTLPVSLGGGLDKVAHFGAYLVLAAALSWGGVRAGVARGWVIALGLAYAATDELHQAFVPGRAVEALDLLADAAGVVAGVAFFYPLFSRLQGLRTP